MIPILHFDGRPAQHVRQAARDTGCFFAHHPLFPPDRCDQAIADARAFFDLDMAAKRSLAIERSPHFRGYSEMRNARDWREQIHFGREEPACDGGPDYLRLRGPNLWPADSAWHDRLLRLMSDLERAGRDILSALAAGLSEREDPYLLLKLIHYPATEVPQSGVAAHVDFSWITLLLQDDTGGLEVCTPSGEWISVPPTPGALSVNLGEILQFATRGYFQATPHRVRNRSATRSRFSLPFFLNPGLDTLVVPAAANSGRRELPGARVPEHVHRVFAADGRVPFVFGEEEWRRKGLGVWCATCVPGDPQMPA
jgi:isopenicillin N synthase-like dioxygenase